MRPVPTNGDVVMVFDALSAAVLVVVCVTALVVGLLSMRYLRQMGNLPRMRALLWGARWFGPIIVAGLALYTAGLFVGVTHTDFPFTALALGRFGGIIIILLPILLLPTQSDGWLLGLLVLTDALRFSSRNYRQWVLNRVEGGGRQSYEWIILAVLLAGPTAAAAGVAWNGYQADLVSQRVHLATRTREAVEQALADQPLRAVTVAPISAGEPVAIRVLAEDDTPDEALEEMRGRVEQALPSFGLDHDWSISLLTRDSRVEAIVKSAVSGSAIISVTATRVLGAEPSRIAIVFSGRTDEERAKLLGDLAEEALAEADLAEGWQINVSPSIGPETMDELDIDLGAGDAGPP